MNAVNPVSSPTVASVSGAEPSMEEILASIRRIIADESALRPRINPEEEPADPSPPRAAPHGAHESFASLPDRAGGISALHFAPPEPPSGEATADPSRHPLAPPAEVADIGSAREPLLSATANSSVTAAFNTLAASRFVDNSEQLMGLVREMIRPLVKAWVDEHLPGMVERIVATEIERMTRGNG